MTAPSRRAVLAGGVATAALAAAGRVRAAAPAPVNVLLIAANDLGYGCLGCNGGTSFSTPALDGMAARGARFTAAYAQPLGAPSTMRLLTGRYAHHQPEDKGHAGMGLTTATLLRTAGHATAIAGEWWLKGGYGRPDAVGFDAWSLWRIAATGPRYWDPMVVQDGQRREDVKRDYGPDVHRKYLLDFVERQAERPFFAFWPMLLAHDPLCPTPDSEGKRKERSDSNRNPAFYADMVAYLDHEVGVVLAALDRLGLAERTLVLFTSDNGSPPTVTYQHDGRPVIGGKGRANTAGMHVPLLASWPGVVPAGAVVDDLVDFVDFLPTIAAATGVELPRVPLDGRSFLPQLRGEPGHPRRAVVGQLDSDGGTIRWARDQRWLLFEDGRFFDTVADPAQQHPLTLEALDADSVVAWSTLEGALDELRH